ncbi:MAG: hypothetical protein AAF125_26350 [Chloroflexota bacterium]
MAKPKRKNNPKKPSRRQFARQLAAERSVDDAKKVALVRTMAGAEEETPRKIGEPHPDWLADKFAAYDEQRKRETQAATSRGYVAVWLMSGAFLLVLVMLVLLQASS